MLANAPDYFGGDYDNVVFARVDFGRFVANSSAAEIWSAGAVSRVGYF